MTRIKLNHQFSDSDAIRDSEVGSINKDGNPDFIDLHLKFGFQRHSITLTKSDIIQIAKGLNVKAEDL